MKMWRVGRILNNLVVDLGLVFLPVGIHNSDQDGYSQAITFGSEKKQVCIIIG
jgi:hypothetical protein